MPEERKALRLFLLLYLGSSLFLLGAGDYLYYQLSKSQLIQLQRQLLQSQIQQFLDQNPFLMRAVRFRSFQIPTGMKLELYLDGEKIFSNSPPLPIKVVHREVKRWWRLEVVAMAPFPTSQLRQIVVKIALFNLFALLLLGGVAVVLGRLFLSPLRQTIQNLEQFIRDATHEMNTPITIILTNIELVEGESPPLRRIETAAHRLSKIFDDLKFIRLHHTRPRQIARYSLPQLVEERLKMVEGLAVGKGIEFKTSLQPVEVEADREDLIRVIDNLLSNAVKYSPPGGVVEVEVGERKFRVVNKGELKNPLKVTEKFYRENRQEGGFGLGLYIVQQVCRHYNWEFNIENRSERVVATIRFG